MVIKNFENILALIDSIQHFIKKQDLNDCNQKRFFQNRKGANDKENYSTSQECNFLELPLTERDLERLVQCRIKKNFKICVVDCNHDYVQLNIIKLGESVLSYEILDTSYFQIGESGQHLANIYFDSIVEGVIKYLENPKIQNLFQDVPVISLAMVCKISFHQVDLDIAFCEKNFLYTEKSYISKYYCNQNLNTKFQEKFDRICKQSIPCQEKATKNVKNPTNLNILVEITVKPSICMYTSVFSSQNSLSCCVFTGEVFNILMCDRQIRYKPIIDSLLYLYDPKCPSKDYEIFRKFILDGFESVDRFDEIVSLKAVIESINNISSEFREMDQNKRHFLQELVKDKLKMFDDFEIFNAWSKNGINPKDFFIRRSATVLAAFIIACLTQNYLIFCRHSGSQSIPEIIIGVSVEFLRVNDDYIKILISALNSIADQYWAPLVTEQDPPESYRKPKFSFSACEDETVLGAAQLCLLRRLRRSSTEMAADKSKLKDDNEEKIMMDSMEV